MKVGYTLFPSKVNLWKNLILRIYNIWFCFGNSSTSAVWVTTKYIYCDQGIRVRIGLAALRCADGMWRWLAVTWACRVGFLYDILRILVEWASCLYVAESVWPRPGVLHVCQLHWTRKEKFFLCFANDCGSYGRLHPTYFMDVHCFSLVIFFLVTLASCTCLSFVSIFLVVFRLSAIYYFKRFVWLSFVVGVKYWWLRTYRLLHFTILVLVRK